MQKIKALLAVAGALLLVGAGCAAQQSAQNASDNTVAETQPAAQPTGLVKVGVMLPLTGDAASYGDSVKKDVELAKKDLNLNNVELVYQDSKCDGKEAVNAVTKLINDDKVVAIIGELCSGATLAAAPVAEQNKVVMVSPASTAPTITQAGDYIFRVIPSDLGQGSFGAKLVAQRGYKRLAVLYSNEDYGVGFNKVLGEEFPKTGGTVVASQAFEKGSTELRTQITKIKEAKPDAVFIASNSISSNPIALKQLKELGVKAAVFGSEGLKTDDLLKSAKGAVEGFTVTSVSGGNEAFVAEHKAAYNSETGPFAAQGYDAMKAVGLAIQSGATTGEEIKAKLYSTEFDGASGHIKFDSNGDVGGNYDVYVVKDGKFEIAK